MDIDAPPSPDSAIDGPLAVTPAICSPRTVGSVLGAGETPLVVRATALASGGYAVGIGMDTGAIHVARILPDGSFGGLHTPMASGYELVSIGAIGDSVFLYVISGAAYVKALDPSWDSYATAQGGSPALIDPPLAQMPGGQGWLGVMNGGTTTFGEVGNDGVSTGLVADYQPITATSASYVSAPSGVRVAIDRGDGTCETLLVAPDGTTSLRETILGCAMPRHARFASAQGILAYEQPGVGFSVRVIDDDLAMIGATTIFGMVDNERLVTRGDQVWIGYTAMGSSEVQLQTIGASGIVSGAAPELRPPFDLLLSGAFWINGLELHTGDTCLK
jgi:hypothetical protein